MAGFTIPNAASAAYPAQAKWYEADLVTLRDGYAGTVVVAGAEVTAQDVPDLTVRVAGGNAELAGETFTVMPIDLLFNPGDSTDPRFDMVAVQADGWPTVLVGAPAQNPAPSSHEGYLALAQVYVPAGATEVTSAMIVDKRLLTDGFDPLPWPRYCRDIVSSGFAPAGGLTAAAAPGLVIAPGWPLIQPAATTTGITIAEGLAIFGCMDGYVRAVPTVGSAAAGWTSALLGAGGVASTPAAGYVGPSRRLMVFVGGGGDDSAEQAYVYGLDGLTGATVWSYAVEPPPGPFVWSSPLLNSGVAIVGVASVGDTPLVQGKVIGLDEATGALVFEFDVVPDGETGGSVWSSVTADLLNNWLFATTGNGGSSTDHCVAVVKLDLNDDLAFLEEWIVPDDQQVADGDFGANPILFDSGGNKYVAVVNKNGSLYILDRENLTAGYTRVPIGEGGTAPEDGSACISTPAWDGTRLMAASGDTSLVLPAAGDATLVRNGIQFDAIAGQGNLGNRIWVTDNAADSDFSYGGHEPDLFSFHIPGSGPYAGATIQDIIDGINNDVVIAGAAGFVAASVAAGHSGSDTYVGVALWARLDNGNYRPGVLRAIDPLNPTDVGAAAVVTRRGLLLTAVTNGQSADYIYVTDEVGSSVFLYNDAGFPTQTFSVKIPGSGAYAGLTNAQMRDAINAQPTITAFFTASLAPGTVGSDPYSPESAWYRLSGGYDPQVIPLWEAELPGPVLAPVSCDSEVAIVGASNQTVIVQSSDGTILLAQDNDGGDGSDMWAPATIDAGVVYQASLGGYVYAYQ